MQEICREAVSCERLCVPASQFISHSDNFLVIICGKVM